MIGRLTAMTVLTVVLTLAAGHVHAGPITAATPLGSDIVYVGATIPDSSWTECPSSGPVADAYGHVYQTIQAICAVGEPLPLTLPIGADIFTPDWKNCMVANYFKSFAMAHGIRCNDTLEGTVDAVPYIYWNNAGALNLSTIASFVAVFGSWSGGIMNSNTGAFQYPYSYDGYHPNVGTIPYKGVPYIGMPVEMTTRTEGDLFGTIIRTERSLQVTYFVSKTFQATSAWFTGSLFEVSAHTTTGLDVADEGGAVYNQNRDQNGNPCLQRNGTILEVVPTTATEFWATNYYTNDLVTLNAEYQGQGRYAPGLHPAGTCVPQSATPTASVRFPGDRILTPRQARLLKRRYDKLSKFLTEERLTALRSIPGVQRIGDTADERGVEIGYFCERDCDMRAIHDAIMGSADPDGVTVADALASHGMSDIKVVVEHHRWEAGRR